MALIDELLKQVSDDALRALIEREVKALRERITFGLVFERHIPEVALVSGNGACLPERGHLALPPARPPTPPNLLLHQSGVVARELAERAGHARASRAWTRIRT